MKNLTTNNEQDVFDQVTGSDGGTIFVVGEVLSLICAVTYYNLIPPSNTNTNTRYLVSMVMGVSIGFFCFGTEYVLIILQAVLCYGALLVLPNNRLSTGVLTFSMLYLNVCLLRRQMTIPDSRIYQVDVSGTLMVATQKVTSLAFGLADGRKTEPMSDLRKRFALKKIPSALEYLSYMLCFQGLMGGPLFFYCDYVDYVQGTDKTKPEKNGKRLDMYFPYKCVAQKLTIGIFWVALHVIFQSHFPRDLNADAEFIKSESFFYRSWYMMISFVGYKAKFYFAFLLGDAICNASGFGFAGFDENGNTKWDLVSNVRISEVEFALNPKTSIDNWNIQTTLWLRHLCYDRVPTYRKQKTFILSATWHGIFPGYWLSALTCGSFVGTFNMMRKKFRPYFLGSRQIKFFYDVLTWMLTYITLCYCLMPFALLDLKPCLDFYSGMYWWLHIVLTVITVTVPFLPTPVTEEKNGGNVRKAAHIE